MHGHPGNHAASLTERRNQRGQNQRGHWPEPGEQDRARRYQKAGLVATHQHIGLVTVLHKGKAVKGGFSIDGRQTAFAARAVILMAAKRCALPRLAETAC